MTKRDDDRDMIAALQKKIRGEILDQVEWELIEAERKYSDFASAHEGYAVILEEIEELWDEVRKKKDSRSVGRMEKEAVQIAAMAIRFVKNICRRAT